MEWPIEYIYQCIKNVSVHETLIRHQEKKGGEKGSIGELDTSGEIEREREQKNVHESQIKRHNTENGLYKIIALSRAYKKSILWARYHFSLPLLFYFPFFLSLLSCMAAWQSAVDYDSFPLMENMQVFFFEKLLFTFNSHNNSSHLKKKR